MNQRTIIIGIFLILFFCGATSYAKEEAEILIQTGHTDVVSTVAFSPDGRHLASGSDDYTLRLWESATGQLVRSFEGHTGSVRAVAFSPDGRYLASGSDDETLRLWERATGQLVRSFEGHTGVVTAVAFSPDGRHLASGSWDGTSKVWDPSNSKLLISLVWFNDGEWVAYTPDNYYLASPTGDQYVTFRIGNKIYEFAQYANIYKRPEIVAKILRGEDIQTDIAVVQKETGVDLNTTTVVEILPPEVVIRFLRGREQALLSPEDQIVEFSEVTISALAIDRKHGLGKVLVSLNGEVVREIIAYGRKEYAISTPVVLKEEENVITLVAVSRKQVRSRPQELHLTNQEAILKGLSLPKFVQYIFGKSKSWAVVIGINDYSPDKNGFEFLPYAANDARKVKDYLVKFLGFSEERVISLYNGDATRKGIEKLLGDDLPKKIKEDDRVLIFFSGHGATKTTGTKKKLGYLVPVDGEKGALHSTAISMRQIETFSDLIPARQILFIIDACYSGIAGVLRKGDKDTLPVHTQEQVRAFAQSRGRQIMTAGTATQTTVMSQKWNDHSLYTYYLLMGLKGNADFNKDKVVTVRELQVYLDNEVPKEANQAQTPQLHDLETTEGQFVFYREGAL